MRLEPTVDLPHSQPTSVQLAGDLTIRGIADAHGQLLDALRSDLALSICVATDALVDLTLVQLIESARRSAEEAGGALVMEAPAQDALLQTLDRGGFLQTPDQRSFWLQTREDQ